MSETNDHVYDLGDDLAFTEDDFREMVLRLAHEVRNPLASIKSSAQLMRRLQMPPSKSLPYLDSVVSEVSRIDMTIKKLEFFASLQLGNVRATEVDDVLRGAAAAVADDASAAGIGIAVESSEPAQIAVDRKLVEVALRELLLNAVQFSPAGAGVVLRSVRTDTGTIAIHVENTGQGIPEQIAQQVRRPFFSTSTQGVGLGLNVVQRVCRLMGCRATWKNQSGGGCRFSLLVREA